MKKNISNAYIALFFLLFILPTVLFKLLGHYIDQPNYEQRNATEKPVFSLDTIDRFPTEYEAYFNDRIPFRTQLIETNSLINYFLFQESPVDMVCIGKDGWLFYNPAGTDGDPMGDYTGETAPSADALQQYADYLTLVNSVMREKNREFVVFVAPNKASIYGSDYLPAIFASPGKQTTGDQVFTYLQEYADVSVVYPKRALLDMIREFPQYDFYLKKDTHWNNLGGYVGSRELLHTLGISIPEIKQIRVEEKPALAGDLASMMGLSKFLEYGLDYELSGYSSNDVIKIDTSIENITHYTGTGKDDRKVLMIRDSYGMAMEAYIASQFNDCYIVHFDYCTPELIEQIDADVVVFECVERYITRLLQFRIN